MRKHQISALVKLVMRNQLFTRKATDSNFLKLHVISKIFYVQLFVNTFISILLSILMGIIVHMITMFFDRIQYYLLTGEWLTAEKIVGTLMESSKNISFYSIIMIGFSVAINQRVVLLFIKAALLSNLFYKIDC